MDTRKEFPFNIENGPSKDRLIDALKYAYGDEGRVDVDFTIAKSYNRPLHYSEAAYCNLKTRNFVISGIKYEDGNGWNFELFGYCEVDLEGIGGKIGYRPCSFEAYYNAKTRKGNITLIFEH